jgi:hypothetical protein
MMRNPAVLAGYLRMTNGIQNLEDEGGLSARQKGFIALMGGPTGFTLLMNPDAMLGVIKTTGLSNNYTPEGETEIGHIIRRLKENGVGLYPWIDGIFNMMGTYGDTFEPDMLGIRHRAIVSSTVNWLRSEGLLGESNMNPGASPYADVMLQGRESISNWVSEFTPDWISKPVNVNAGGSAGQASLDQIIASRIMAENPGMTNGELATVMSDPDSEEYKSAFNDAARSGVISQMLSFTLPARFRGEENTRDIRARQRDLISKEAAEAGINPWELSQSTADAEFRATYQAQTGKEFEAGDWNTITFKNELARATPEARQFVVWEHEYQQIADELAPGVAQTYYGIMNGSISPPGSNIDPSQLDPATREHLAQQWLFRTGKAEEFEASRNMQRAYEAQHPEFAQYKDWSRQMRDLQAALGGTLSEYRRQASSQNPYAANYFAQQQEYLRSRGLRDAELAEAMDQMTLAPSTWYAIGGRPMTVYDQAPSDAGLGDPGPAMAQPYMGANGYIDPFALQPQDPAVAGSLMGQPMQTSAGTAGYYGGEPTQGGPVDWVSEAQQYRR